MPNPPLGPRFLPSLLSSFLLGLVKKNYGEHVYAEMISYTQEHQMSEERERGEREGEVTRVRVDNRFDTDFALRSRPAGPTKCRRDSRNLALQ